MNICGLDIETVSLDPERPELALQPWRVKEGLAKVTYVGFSMGDDRSKAVEFGRLFEVELDRLQVYQEVTHFVTFNGVFDIAFLYASGVAVDSYQWIDAQLIWKWVTNCQQKERIPAWSLVDAINEFFPGVAWADEFVEMKKNEDRDDQYWEDRSKADAYVTLKLMSKTWGLLTAQQQKSALIEAQCLVPVAKSWVRGVRMAMEEVESKRPGIEAKMTVIEERLQTIRTVLRSPKQLCNLLYDTWALPIDKQHLTPKGDPSSSKAALTYLADQDDRILEIIAWRKLNTQLTKFLNSPLKAREYVGSSTLHPQPKLFSTYTGRMTYGSKIKKKYPVGMALHQWPREKDIRELIEPPEGYDLVEFDAAGQEMRLMADYSQDESMLRVFRMAPPDDDAHSYTGAKLAGIPFEKFLELKAAGNKSVSGEHGYRYQGKFTNLSCQYRIGVKSFRIKSRVDYGMNVDYLKAKSLQAAYFQAYPGIKTYWRSAIELARVQGYAETRAGRRMALTDWHRNEWGTQQTAINFPIQGTGGDMKELALAVLTPKFPELIFGFDLHDALFMYIKSDHPHKMDVLRSALNVLDNLPYKQAWGWEPSTPIPWDGSIGPDWGNMEEI